MNPEIKDPNYNKWQKLDSIFVFLAFVYFMLYHISPVYWGSVYVFFFRMTAAAAIAFYIYFRHRSDTWDVKIVFAFGIWLILTRIINGDISLADEGTLVLDFWTSALILGSFAMLPRRERERLFDLICAAMGLFHTVLGAIALYASINSLSIHYPAFLLLDEDFCYFYSGRLYMLANNTNICGNWFFVSMAMMLYELIKQKKWYWKTASAIGLVFTYMALALTMSRSSTLGGALLLAAAAAFLFLKYCRLDRRVLKNSLAVLLFAVIFPLSYKSFSFSAMMVENISDRIVSEGEYAAEETEQAAAVYDIPQAALLSSQVVSDVADDEDERTHERTVGIFTDTGRIDVYKGFIYTVAKNPIRLIKGSLREGEMDLIYEYLKSPIIHFHNSVLQSLEFTGIPGFTAVVLFFLLMTIRSIRLIFSKADITVKIIAVSVLSIMFYNMLETSAFYYTDVREMSFFVLSGMVIAASQEICPFKNTEKIK